jgi:hypothetical protein
VSIRTEAVDILPKNEDDRNNFIWSNKIIQGKRLHKNFWKTSYKIKILQPFIDNFWIFWFEGGEIILYDQIKYFNEKGCRKTFESLFWKILISKQPTHF